MAQRGELRDLAAIFRCNILDISKSTLTFEILGKEEKMKALTDMLEPYGGCWLLSCNKSLLITLWHARQHVLILRVLKCSPIS